MHTWSGTEPRWHLVRPPIHRLWRTFHALVVLLLFRGACRCWGPFPWRPPSPKRRELRRVCLTTLKLTSRVAHTTSATPGYTPNHGAAAA